MNLKEIFGIAEQIEENGAAFYNETSEIYQLLKQLENEEKDHMDIFRKYNEIFTAKSSVQIGVIDETSRTYINSLAGQFVFDKKNNKTCINKNTTKEDVFNFAIESEKDAILFYLGLKDIIVEEKNKNSIDNKSSN